MDRPVFYNEAGTLVSFDGAIVPWDAGAPADAAGDIARRWAGWVDADKAAGGTGGPEAYAPSIEPAITVRTKADIWRRATDPEAEAMDGMLATQSVRIRRIYDGCQEISSADELYPILEAGLTQAFGAERAGELLAPSA